MALGLASVDASAQWYIFPGFKKNAKDSLSVKVKQPVDTVVAVPLSIADTVITEDFIADLPQTVNVGLLLPFESKGGINSQMMEFYCGALLATRDLGKEGLDIALNVYDCSPGEPGISDWELSNTDVLIGPVSFSDLVRQLDIHPEGQYFISPVDAQATQLAKDYPVVQASAGTDIQIREMIAWLSSEMTAADKLVIVEEKGVAHSGFSRKVFGSLDSLKIPYEILSYGILQGLKIGDQFINKSSSSGITRFIIASENESFVGDAVRNIALLQHRGHEVALYGTSRLRSYQSIEADDFHSVGLRLAATFYTDYSSPDVKSFVLSYRTLFNAEPGSFAFSGYDITRFFTSLCANAGRNWEQVIDGYYGRGMYSNFLFEREEGSIGAFSTAVRRLVYNPDYTITLTN